MKCNNCVNNITKNLLKHENISEVHVSLQNQSACVTHTQALDAQQIAEIIRNLNSKWQVEVVPNSCESLVSVEGMRCNNCVNNITKNLLANEHISKVHVSLENQ